MKKILIIAAVLIGVIAATVLLRRPEPTYAGKPFSFWFEQLYTPNTNGIYNSADRDEALYAFRKMGTNVYPLLVEEHLVSDRRIRLREISHNLKHWLFRNLKSPRPYVNAGQIRFEAGQAILSLGPSAQTLLPLLRKSLKPGTEDYVKAIYLLGSVSENREQVVPILAGALKQAGRARGMALQSLIWMGESSDAALPELLQLFQSAPRIQQVICLVGNIGPNAKVAVPQLQKLCAPGNGLEFFAACALYQIEPENQIALNILTNFTAVRPDRLQNLAWAIRMARRVSIDFIQPLVTHSNDQVRAQAIRALEKKSPQAAADALRNILNSGETDSIQTAGWLLRIDRNSSDAQNFLISRRYSARREQVLEYLGESSPQAKEVISSLNFDATQNIDVQSQNEAKRTLKRIKIRELMQAQGWTNNSPSW